MAVCELGLCAGASGEPDRVRRSAVAVAACLACDLCGGMLDNPVTVPECMHSFCRACIDAALSEASRSAGAQCPACAEVGEATMLGVRPYADRRLQPDVVLAELARKLFPVADRRRDDAFRLARARRTEFEGGLPGNIAPALARYVAEQLGLPQAEAVELACGRNVLPGVATLGETLDALRAQGGSNGLIEYGVGGSGAESLMLSVTD
ncbi:hypothetical protein WJX81_007275 [Elliptochloris bilobata]|uniref:RING-type domain-containing protein n=1 Tax=Elliptochloris bilobata TaxID=381761 RepID=A0AAW1QIM9_9CHLO